MAISIAIWSQDVKPKDTVVILPVADLRITNIALGETLADKNGRTTVKLVYQAPNVSDDEDEEKEDEDSDAEGKSEAVATVLCSLTPGKIESATIDLILNEGEEYILETVGPNVVHLTGNYIDQNPLTAGPDDYSDMDSEDEFDLQDVGSDVEINPDDIEMDGDSDASRFEEVTDEAPKSAKRALEEESVSKAEKKKNKKQKAANGEAVPTGEEEEKPKSKKEKKEKAEKEAPKPAAAEKELPGGLKVKDAKVGSGPAAKKGKRVEMRYIGKFPNGKVFDSNTKGKPFAFRLGGGEVIKGWDEGIVGMQVGGERVLTVPPALAYGKKGVSGIPPNSTLIFEVKLLTVK